ncbi:hypothetical protein NE562_11560 [Butyricicoccus faecihominis]|uniref:hypothetical protein n=1 Tax=Butyricicoccus faecihominis TaxID=1712515 RepID=UPI00247870C2|nr:hypothetical protein [Butyricicoccus faecihominis]MCQ5130300.1 hypothetical protein [Butyricicoccus faecihominis]
MAYADYSYYKTTYGGTMIAESAFARLSCLASAYIDSLTFGNAAKDTEHAEQIKTACCALAEEYQRQDSGGEVASETVGKWSKTYLSSGQSFEQRLYRVAAFVLAPTGLLYGGVY